MWEFIPLSAAKFQQKSLKKLKKGEVGKGKECFFIEEREKGRKRKDEF